MTSTTARGSLAAFVRARGITARATQITARPDGLLTDLPRHFRVVLAYGSRRMTVYFSQGSAHTAPPTAEDVLDCLAADFITDSGDSFESWCAELGYDTDSRTAERTYRAQKRQAAKLARFLSGTDTDLDTLVYHTERL
jgi:hypothetical protein